MGIFDKKALSTSEKIWLEKKKKKRKQLVENGHSHRSLSFLLKNITVIAYIETLVSMLLTGLLK